MGCVLCAMQSDERRYQVSETSKATISSQAKIMVSDIQMLKSISNDFHSLSTHTGLRWQDFVPRRILGIGAFGLVRLYIHEPSGQEFAVKEMWKAQLEMRSQNLVHIMTEKYILRRNFESKCPFLLQLTASFQDPEKIYFVTSVCRGGDLFSRIVASDGTAGPLRPEESLFYAATMVQALHVLHAREVIYRGT